MNEYTKYLADKYGLLMTAKQVQDATGRSVRSLEVDRRNKTGIPYKRLGTAPNSPVRYPCAEVAQWISETEKTL